MKKLRTVIRHEYRTIISQPSFWIALISMPALMLIVGTLAFMSSKTSMERISELTDEIKHVIVIDESELVNQEVVKNYDFTIESADKLSDARAAVRDGDVQALIHYPKDITKTRTYNTYIDGNDITLTSSVSSLGDNLLKTSLFAPLGSAEVIALAQDGAHAQTINYEDGVQTGGINEYIAPGLFLVLFYVILMFSISYMLSSVSEEKENRSMEIVLTYVKPRTLITGKLLGVTLVALTQITFYIVLGIIGLLVAQQFGDALAMPAGLDPELITFNFWPIFFGLAYLMVGFLLFAGFMVATAAATPSAKEANSFSAVFLLGAFIPIYFVTLIATNPENIVVQILTYFPITSPVITQLRNTLGSMELLESWIALVTMTLFMILTLWVAVRAFRLGALEFGNTIKLSKLLKK